MRLSSEWRADEASRRASLADGAASYEMSSDESAAAIVTPPAVAGIIAVVVVGGVVVVVVASSMVGSNCDDEWLFCLLTATAVECEDEDEDEDTSRLIMRSLADWDLSCGA